MKTRTLTPELLHRMDAYWRAANYLSVGQIYLYDNPLLRRPLALADVKHMLLGHWGTTPGQNFIYVHLNRVIKKYNLDMIYVSGPGHGGPAVVANTYLEGTYSPLERLERMVHPWTSYLVLPLFALVNAGVAFSAEFIRQAFTSAVTLGVMLGLVVGKVVGVTGRDRFCKAGGSTGLGGAARRRGLAAHHRRGTHRRRGFHGEPVHHRAGHFRDPTD
jgi:hypothetical protein